MLDSIVVERIWGLNLGEWLLFASLILLAFNILTGLSWGNKNETPKADKVDETPEEEENLGPYDPCEMFLDDYTGPYPKCACGAEIKKMFIFCSGESEDCGAGEYLILTCPECYRILPAIRNS